MESELEEAQSIATAANHKFEDAQRKCKVVEGDLERIIERAEEFEGKARDLETQVREMEGKVKETEAITVKVHRLEFFMSHKLLLHRSLLIFHYFRTPKKKINSKTKFPVFRKNSSWLTLALNSLKDLLISSKPPLTAFLNLS